MNPIAMHHFKPTNSLIRCYLVFHGDIAGIKNTGTGKSKLSGCEFCFWRIVAWNKAIPRVCPMNAVQPNDIGHFQVNKSTVTNILKGEINAAY